MKNQTYKTMYVNRQNPTWALQTVRSNFKAMSAPAFLLILNRRMYLHNLLKGQIWRKYITS